MQLEELQENWNAFAKGDPFWAVLTSPDAKNGGWRPDKFFETGKTEIDTLMKSMPALQGTGRRRALDFGCAVGRLTQALCEHFVECSGVDISAEMLRLAEEFNRYGARCAYRLNATNDLRLFEDNHFDFVYSNIVLQNMNPEYAANYIREFVRVLVPGGLIVFQVPAEVVKSPPNVASAPMRLPDAAFNASIRPIEPPRTMPPGGEAKIVAVVRNLSSIPWPRSCIFMGNHWLTARGTPFQFDDARVWLAADLPPGGEAQVVLTVKAPAEPGSYLLELDMVQEGIAWFKQCGSETASFPIKVKVKVARTRAVASKVVHAAPAQPAFKARMEMYGIALETIVKIVTGSGGRFVEIKEDTSAGPDWRSYRYSVTKDEPTLEPPIRYFYSEHDMPLESPSASKTVR